MIKYVKGNLFDMVTMRTIIPHVCNNENKWGRGFVVPLVEHYFSARQEFADWANRGYYVQNKQDGSYYLVPYRIGYTQFVNVDTTVYVSNMIGQVLYVQYGSIRQYRPLYYNKLADCMEQVARFVWENRNLDLKILAPKFGSELAGGKWEFVECLIQDIWDGIPVTIVEYEK